jgi:hypothetical protein
VDPSAPEALSAEKTIELADQLIRQLDEQIRFADTKSQLALGANAFLLGVYSAHSGGRMITILGAQSALIDRLEAAIVVGAIAALFISIYTALLVARPSLFNYGQSALYFFGAIADQPADHFVSAFRAQSLDAAAQAILTQVHAKSVIARKKFADVRRSINFLFVSLVLWGLYQFVVFLR